MMRLDVYLLKFHGKYSRAFYQKFIKKFGIIINGKCVKKAHYLVKENDKISFTDKEIDEFLKISTASKISPVRGDIIFKEKKFLAINKPPFINTESLTADLFPVHRLDKNTSGILIIANDFAMQAALQKQWQDRTVKKTYTVLLKGHLKPKNGAIEGNISRSLNDRKKMAISSVPRSKFAYTKYKIVDYFDVANSQYALVKAYPLTGRTHQIRVHFASIGHPVVGDSVYGDKKLNKKIEQECGLKRQFLHASELTLKNPRTGKKLKLTSNLPLDLSQVLEKLAAKKSSKRTQKLKRA